MKMRIAICLTGMLVCVQVLCAVSGSSAGSNRPADVAWMELEETMRFLETEEGRKAYEKLAYHEKSAAQEQYLRRVSTATTRFFEDFPRDERRLRALAVFMSNEVDPTFITHYTPVPSEAERWGAREWSEYILSLPVDTAARDEWLRKNESMVAEIVASSRYSRREQEGTEWQLFGRRFRLATQQRRLLQSVDWSVFVRHFDAHIKKYPDMDTLGQRAEDYLGALKGMEPELAAAGWKHLLDSTPAGSPAAGIRNLHVTADKQMQELKSVAGGNLLDLVKFTAVDGREVDMVALRGKVVLLEFWATWCKPCVEQIPAMKALYEKYHSQGLEIIGIACDGGSKEKLTDFLTEHSIPWRQHFDGNHTANAMARRFNITAWPTTCLVGKDGKLIEKDIAGPALEAAIRKALGS